MHLSWAKIVDARTHPKYSFVGGYLVGLIGQSHFKCRYFAGPDEALAHARTVCPVVWRNLENHHHKKKFRKPNGLPWQIYDPQTSEWVNLRFCDSPFWIRDKTLLRQPHEGVFILRATPAALDDLAPSLLDNYIRIVGLIADLDERVSLHR